MNFIRIEHTQLIAKYSNYKQLRYVYKLNNLINVFSVLLFKEIIVQFANASNHDSPVV